MLLLNYVTEHIYETRLLASQIRYERIIINNTSSVYWTYCDQRIHIIRNWHTFLSLKQEQILLTFNLWKWKLLVQHLFFCDFVCFSKKRRMTWKEYSYPLFWIIFKANRHLSQKTKKEEKEKQNKQSNTLLIFWLHTVQIHLSLNSKSTHTHTKTLR